MNVNIINPPIAEDLHEDLRTDGWQDGPPAHVPAWALILDQRTAKRLKCRCGHRGMSPSAYHRGTEYRVLATCPECGSTEEI